METGNPGYEIGHIIISRLCNDLFGGSDLNQYPVFHDGNAITQADGFVKIVGNEKRCFVHHGGELKKLILQLTPNQGVQSAERFVHQQNIGVGGQGPGQAHTLLHTTGEFIRITMAPACQLHGFQCPVCNSVALIAVNLAKFKSESYILADIAMRQQSHILKDHADLFRPDSPQFIHVHLVHILTLDEYFSGGRFDQSVDVPDEG